VAKTKSRAQRPTEAGRRPVLDDLDWRLLTRLQDDARVSSAELARHLQLSAPGLQKRLRRLEDKGVIERYSTVVNREAVGLDLLCFVLVMLAHHRPDSVQRFRDGIRAMPEVLECHYLTGEFDCLMKLVVSNHEELQRFLERLMKVGGVDRLRTSIVLNEIKAGTSLPLNVDARKSER
jgi:Lrp/AsnC family transcriptional regulator, leucine-responsive regulatory protein